mmetsp:Transcript_44770/g.69815  ORF Transcript_44770/g.69815 Transcript_44770/m.69815 type:complete len:228 (+) Transcript_44770:159-842(+)
MIHELVLSGSIIEAAHKHGTVSTEIYTSYSGSFSLIHTLNENSGRISRRGQGAPCHDSLLLLGRQGQELRGLGLFNGMSSQELLRVKENHFNVATVPGNICPIQIPSCQRCFSWRTISDHHRRLVVVPDVYYCTNGRHMTANLLDSGSIIVADYKDYRARTIYMGNASHIAAHIAAHIANHIIAHHTVDLGSHSTVGLGIHSADHIVNHIHHVVHVGLRSASQTRTL